MTKEEFKARWESDDSGGGITYEDIAKCYVEWGLGVQPFTKLMSGVCYTTLRAANTVDAEEFRPE